MGFRGFMVALAVAVAVGRAFITPRLVNIPTVEGVYEALAHSDLG
jgi:hypothetical protein